MTWVTTYLTATFFDKVHELLSPSIAAVGLPRFSMEQTDSRKGATRYVGEVVATYPELAAFEGITESQIRSEGVEIRVRDLAATPEGVLRDEHVGWVLRRGNALLAMIDSSGVKLYLQMPGLGRANAANQLMVQLLEAVRHVRADKQPPRMLMPAADNREGRNVHQIEHVQKYALEHGVEWLQGGTAIDWTDFGTQLAKKVSAMTSDKDTNDKKEAAVRAAIQKLEAGEHGQLAECKLPFPLRYLRDRGRPVIGQRGGKVVVHSWDPRDVATVQALVRGLARRRSWSTIGAAVASINPKLPMPDADGNDRYFADLDDWGEGAKRLVITKSRDRPRTDRYLFANLQLWREGVWPTIRSIDSALQGWHSIEVDGTPRPIATPERGARFVEVEARWNTWPTGADGQPLVAYELTDDEFDAAAAELVGRRGAGRGQAQVGPRTNRATTKLVGDIPFQQLKDDVELRTYASGSGRTSGLIVARGAPGTNRKAAQRIARVPLGRLVRALTTSAVDATADLLDQAATFTPPPPRDTPSETARLTAEHDQIAREIATTDAAHSRAIDLAARATNDCTGDKFNTQANELGEQLEILDKQLARVRAELAAVEERVETLPSIEHLRLADLLAIGLKTDDGTAPTPLARLFLGLFDWSSWHWVDIGPDTETVPHLLHAQVDMVVPLIEGGVTRVPVCVAVRPSKGNGVDPADRVRTILLEGTTLYDLATVEDMTRDSLVATCSRWLRRAGCALPMAALDSPHPQTRQAVWALAISDDQHGLDAGFVEQVRAAYFTDDTSWTNHPGTGTHTDEPDDHTLAQTIINSLLRLRNPLDGAHENTVTAAIGCSRTDYERGVLGWSCGSHRIPRPAYVLRHPDGRLTPVPCMNDNCSAPAARRFASTVRFTPLTRQWGLVCPDCGHMPDPELQTAPLPATYRTPVTDATVSLTAATPTLTVPQVATRLATSEFLVGAILEEHALPYRWQAGHRRIPTTLLDQIAHALDARQAAPEVPSGMLTVPDVAARLHLTAEKVRHLTRTGTITRTATTTDTGGWLYDKTHIRQLHETDAVAGYRHDTVTRPAFAAILGLGEDRNAVRRLRQHEENDPHFPTGFDLPRGQRRWLIADARQYAARFRLRAA